MAEAPSYTVSFYYRRVLVAVDGSELSMKALMLAADFAMRYGSKVTVAYVKPRGSEPLGDPIAKAKERLKSMPVAVSYKYLEYDPESESPASALVKEVIEGGYDLVIIGARGRTALSELSIGSVALSVVVNAPASVLVVR